MRPPGPWSIQPDDCPLCQRREAATIGTRDRSGAPLRIVLCHGCGLVRVSPRPSPEAHRDFYERQSRREDKNARLPSPRRMYRHARIALDRLEWIRQTARPGARVLDAGCDGGETVFVLSLAGFDARGIEPDPVLASYARECLGVPVQNAWVEQSPPPQERFDVVCSFHLIEHTLDPVAFLQKLRAAAAPGGRLALETPNLQAPFPPPARRWHKAHLYYFTADTLADCARAAGWKLLSLSTPPTAAICGSAPSPSAPARQPRTHCAEIRLWSNGALSPPREGTTLRPSSGCAPSGG